MVLVLVAAVAFESAAVHFHCIVVVIVLVQVLAASAADARFSLPAPVAADIVALVNSMLELALVAGSLGSVQCSTDFCFAQATQHMQNQWALVWHI